MSIDDSLYYLPNARSEAQRQEMIALQRAGICIFCEGSYSRDLDRREVLLQYSTDDQQHSTSLKKQVLWENASWAILRNEYPYDGASQHLMLVPKAHVTSMDQLSGYEWAELANAMRQAAAMAGSRYYVLGIRNGDMRYTGATIQHLHIQFVVGDPDNDGEPVKLYMSSRPADSPSS